MNAVPTVQNKIRDLDRQRKDPSRKRTRAEKEREEQAAFQTFWTLAIAERSDVPTLYSDEAHAANKIELARLRKKFANDPRAKLADPVGWEQSHAEEVKIAYA